MSGAHQLAITWSEFVHEPLKFVATFWPHYTLAPYQSKILQSCAVNTETWVHSAHEMGKSFVAGMSALWWFATRKSKVRIISASEKQLRDAMWGEINKLLRTATYNGEKFDFGFVRNDLQLRYADEADSPDPEFFLRLTAAAEGAALHGAHVPTIEVPNSNDEIGTVFWIVEEASGVPDEFFDVAATQRHCMLVLGNPVTDSGKFAEVCKAGSQKHPVHPSKLFRNVIHVSGDDSPNVKLGKAWRAAGRTGEPPKRGPNGEIWRINGVLSYDEYMLRYNTYSAFDRRTRLFGLFPEEEGQQMFPSSWLDIAQRLGAMLREWAKRRSEGRRLRMPGRPFSLGIDVSQGGGDLTSWVIWGRFGVAKVEAMETPNTATIAGRTIQLMREWRIHPAWVAFDAGGGGKQIADQLRDRGFEHILDVDFGGSADDPRKYKNKRAELYGELREAMQPSGLIQRMLKMGSKGWAKQSLHCASLPPDDSELRRDLAVLPMLRDGEGRLRMLPKEKTSRKGGGEKSLRQLLGRSPDRGDACALAYYAWKAGKEFKSLEYIDGDLVY